MSFYTFVREPQVEWSDYHQFLYTNTFQKTSKIWNHPKLGPFFRCLRMHAKTNDKGNFMKILARNPFLFAEPGRQKQKQKSRKSSLTLTLKKEDPNKQTTSEEKRIEARDARKAALKRQIRIKKARKAREAKKKVRASKASSSRSRASSLRRKTPRSENTRSENRIIRH